MWVEEIEIQGHEDEGRTGQGLLGDRKPLTPTLNFFFFFNAFLIARCLYQPVLQRVQREDKGHQRRHSPAYKDFCKGAESRSIFFLALESHPGLHPNQVATLRFSHLHSETRP